MAATMSDQGETGTRASTTEAARAFGVSEETIRRWVRDGRLDAHVIQVRRRPAYRIDLPADLSSPPPRPSATEPDLGAIDHLASPPIPREGRPTMDISARTPSDQTIAAVIQASITPIVAPLTAAIDAYRQVNERQVEQLVVQAEQLGRLRAKMAALRAARMLTARRGGSRNRAAGREPAGAGGSAR
jgi:excisionase family DNA binding protein